MKINKILTRVLILSLITMSFMYTSGLVTLNHSPFETTYQSMSTMQLEAEVEKRSLNGSLPFDMGRELMHRWSKQ